MKLIPDRPKIITMLVPRGEGTSIVMILGRPGGMRGGAGGRLDGGLRSADLRFAISDLWFRFDTPALAIRQGRRIAPRIPPGLLWAMGSGNGQ